MAAESDIGALYNESMIWLMTLSGTIGSTILIIADYQHKAAFVSDRELNLVACLVEIMGTAKFK